MHICKGSKNSEINWHYLLVILDVNVYTLWSDLYTIWSSGVKGVPNCWIVPKHNTMPNAQEFFRTSDTGTRVMVN